MNGVDHKDRDTADWTVSLKSNWFNLRIFYWLFDDGVLHAMYCIVKVVARDKAHPWHKYLSKHSGRYKFQMDLANSLNFHCFRHGNIWNIIQALSFGASKKVLGMLSKFPTPNYTNWDIR
jgi:hypothetical protein